ncbi:MAG: class I SAM-dependent methyltransferase [Chloroflexota bacterium]|nr:class I SAM-dependent methyltransferase [Chloroflexota bacterium]
MADREKLSRLLRNESDMAFKRRVPILMEYLELRKGDHILDCGCGMGFYLKALNVLGEYGLFGLDFDRKPLGFARRELGGTAALVRGDVLALPYADESFDKVIMAEVLEHLRDDQQGAREVRRVLIPGGILALSVPHKDYPFLWDPINRTLETLLGRPIRTGPLAGIWANHYRLYRPAEVVEVLEGAGFEMEEVREHTHYCFPFIHNIVYGLGKPLIEHDLLPEFLSRSAHRFRSEENTGSPLNPMNWALALFNWVDHFNESRDLSDKRTFMNITVKARKV